VWNHPLSSLFEALFLPSTLRTQQRLAALGRREERSEMVILVVATTSDPASIGPAAAFLAMPGWSPGPPIAVSIHVLASCFQTQDK
jgi:hypothetical protein